MHLVVGATGLVGGTVARHLRERGLEVSALVRGGPTRKEAAGLTQAGVRVAAGQLEDHESVATACAGVDTVTCTVTAMPAAAGDALKRIDHDGILGLIETAESAGVQRFVYVSYSAGINVDSPLGQAKRACEARLAASAMESVVLMPSFFMQVWLGPHLGFDVANARARIYGDGTAGISYVSALDVARFAVAAATMPGPMREKVEIGGPEVLSQLDAVALFERVHGRDFAIETVPVSALEAQRQSPDPLQQTFAALMLSCAQGNPVPSARANADRYGVRLASVEDYVAGRLG
jgi:uncharacterized protein YbjT (DUF2867 family)